MSTPYQECALYGELVRHLRDRAAELLAQADSNMSVESATQQIDEIIRAWFFIPQKDLMGLAPRDVIWAEQMDKPNPIPPEHIKDMFDDDCPICQAMHEDVEKNIAAGHDHGWQWHYDDGGFPLIAQYDPEGWDARWAVADARGEDLEITPDEFTQTWNELLDDSPDEPNSR